MSFKAVTIFCAQAILAQVAFSQCIRSGEEYAQILPLPSAGYSSCGSLGANSLGYGGGLGFGSGLGIGLGSGNSYSGIGLNIGNIGGTGGGAFPINSVAPIAPNGIAVTSENVYEGSLGVIGELPFLSTVALEGVLPSAGAGIVNHGHGNGITTITSEINNAAGAIGSAGIGSGFGFGSAGIGSGAYGIGSAGIGAGAYGIGTAGIGSGAFGLGSTGIGCGSGIGAISSGAGGIGRIGGRTCGCGL